MVGTECTAITLAGFTYRKTVGTKKLRKSIEIRYRRSCLGAVDGLYRRVRLGAGRISSDSVSLWSSALSFPLELAGPPLDHENFDVFPTNDVSEVISDM
jgi:hypothetical protein